MHEREFEGVKDTKTISPYFLYHTGCLFFSERELVHNTYLTYFRDQGCVPFDVMVVAMF